MSTSSTVAPSIEQVAKEFGDHLLAFYGRPAGALKEEEILLWFGLWLQFEEML